MLAIIGPSGCGKVEKDSHYFAKPLRLTSADDAARLHRHPHRVGLYLGRRLAERTATDGPHLPLGGGLCAAGGPPLRGPHRPRDLRIRRQLGHALLGQPLGQARADRNPGRRPGPARYLADLSAAPVLEVTVQSASTVMWAPSSAGASLEVKSVASASEWSW